MFVSFHVETGIKLNREGLELISITNDIVHDAHFVTIGFLCGDFEGEAQVMEPDEITKWHWFPLNELPEKIFPPSQKILNNYLEKEMYKN